MDYLSLFLLVSFVWASIHVIVSIFGVKADKSLKLPPGPRPYPIIGNMFDMEKLPPHKAITKLSQTYGPILTLKLGSATTIIISSPQVAKEVFQKNDQIFSYRPAPDTMRAQDHNKFAVAWLPSPSTHWKILRRACATKVFSPKMLDSTQVLREKKVQELMEYVDACSKKGEALDLGKACFKLVLNSISNTLFSMDLAHYTNDKSQEFVENLLGVMEEAGKPNLADSFPIIRLLDPQGCRAKMYKYFGNLMAIFDGIIEERLRLRVKEMESTGSKDALDSMLELMLEENPQLDRTLLLHLFVDLFMAGVDTTSITMEWAVAELIHNPEKLEKVKKELQQVINKGEQLGESHISKLPYLQAVVKETLRLHPPAPFLGLRMPGDNVEISGYMVPKNTRIMTNVWAMGRDPNIWTNPNEFMPERLLGSEIDFRGRDFELFPFGAGRRICPGLPLAFKTVHNVVGTLVNSYDWKLADGRKAEDMDMSETYGVTLHKAKPLLVIPMQA